ncbi:Eco57I restriction-modification methylase domain-containing protein [Mangrovimonas futianensis]|uniref:Eco57I restriction-modification methylase domain-containing protein n=1 Tax=Mangrovimonas futianensis TaxID=2895523 RepID=UPI001E58B888|nr:N-6 DNA methylase [Mangrovimonas futianensis]MCF1420316.1 BREX-1 system adenine-specific DNA-methyltransferase PglX [Mangrovimonas futianensis]
MQQEIRNMKEEEYQDGFLDDLFVNVLGYIKRPKEGYTLIREKKNETNGKKADGAILKNDSPIAVIELKGADTTDLDKITNQAFGYKNNHTDCIYVVTSNFEKLRFYIHNAVEHIEFNLFNLSPEDFKLMWLCLHSECLLNNIPLKAKEESVVVEENITKQLYKDYSAFKHELWRNVCKNAPDQDKLLLFKKSQKLLDRFLFIFFAEDSGLLPPNSISRMVERYDQLIELDAQKPLYDIFKQYFDYINLGRKGKTSQDDIFAYNGGLFLEDNVLDAFIIDDDLLKKHILKLTAYDFQSDVDVNILGHIFENSLNDIENVTAQLEGHDIDKSKTKRKKDGVFYTPKYITKYIVENTVGKLCEERKTEFGVIDEEYAKGRRNRKKETIKKLDESLKQYRDWLLNITICDPACGSGAFLNQALEFLMDEHHYIDSLESQLLGYAFEFPGVENHILEKNIFGVDINEESVEIAKLSLWLRTAQRGRKLTSLNNNIKCGNSLIDDPEVAGDKAFDWQKEFPKVFERGGFDVIIGNPPYGAYLNQVDKNFLSQKFNTFQGNFEVYFFFIELLDFLSNENGVAGYITPDTWINIPQAQRLREFVLKSFGVLNIVTFSYSVFEDASVNAIAFILDKGNVVDTCKIIHSEDKTKGLILSNNITQESDINIWKKSDDKQFQVWQSTMDINIIEKIKLDVLFGLEVLDVSQGIVPYSAEHLTKEEIKERIYHNDSCLGSEWGEWVQGRAISRYCIDKSEKQYLKYGDWLHRSRKPKYFNGSRILIQEITGGNPPRISATIYSEQLYHDPGIISCINISKLPTEYLLAVINSKLISWFNIKTTPKGKRTTFPKVLIGDIRKLPFKKANDDFILKIKTSVSLISEQSINLQNQSEVFLSLLKSKFKIKGLSKKIFSWDLLEFDEFIKELEKSRKNSAKENGIEYTKLSLSEEAEWMQYFNEQKQKAQELKQQIDKTDKEIDQMVYELYGLTQEEIEIVENS